MEVKKRRPWSAGKEARAIVLRLHSGKTPQREPYAQEKLIAGVYGALLEMWDADNNPATTDYVLGRAFQYYFKHVQGRTASDIKANGLVPLATFYQKDCQNAPKQESTKLLSRLLGHSETDAGSVSEDDNSPEPSTS